MVGTMVIMYYSMHQILLVVLCTIIGYNMLKMTIHEKTLQLVDILVSFDSSYIKPWNGGTLSNYSAPSHVSTFTQSGDIVWFFNLHANDQIHEFRLD